MSRTSNCECCGKPMNRYHIYICSGSGLPSHASAWQFFICEDCNNKSRSEMVQECKEKYRDNR